MSQQVFLEFTKALFTVTGGVIAAAFAARYWSAWQKRRELQLTAADTFYKLYGEFFAVWKLWNSWVAGATCVTHEAVPEPLVARACSAEGAVEAVLVRLASERKLTAEDQEALGRFRQAYQALRETVCDEERRPLAWGASDHPEYASFKHLACQVAVLLSSPLELRPPNSSDASVALRRITSNEFEHRWVLDRFTKGWRLDGRFEPRHGYWRRDA